MITIEVLGTPAPKGSGRAMLIGGKARFIASGTTVNQRKLKSWDTALREAALEAIGHAAAPPYMGLALRLEILFRLARPTGHWGQGKNAGKLKPNAPAYPLSKPDSSKLLRAIEDTLNKVVFDDDSRIVRTHMDKVYADAGNEGATIKVMPMACQTWADLERQAEYDKRWARTPTIELDSTPAAFDEVSNA